jgi:hypothetical protein
MTGRCRAGYQEPHQGGQFVVRECSLEICDGQQQSLCRVRSCTYTAVFQPPPCKRVEYKQPENQNQISFPFLYAAKRHSMLVFPQLQRPSNEVLNLRRRSSKVPRFRIRSWKQIAQQGNPKFRRLLLVVNEPGTWII